MKKAARRGRLLWIGTDNKKPAPENRAGQD
jgi:hypothetical protein